MRKVYSERRDFFIEQFNKLLSDRFTLDVPETGLNIVAWLKREEDFEAVRRISVEIGVRPSLLSYFCIQAMLTWAPAQIRESVVKLASALKAKGI